jgi:hypothetical protein
MITNEILPEALNSIIGNEKVDFLEKAKRSQPLKKSIVTIVFGVIWTGFTSIFVFAFLGPVFSGEVVHFKSNGIPTEGSLDNFQPLLMPTIIITVFVLVGIALTVSGIYALFQQGGYFVGTSTRLIKFSKGIVNSYDWEQFTGNIELNIKKGDISLELRTGKMVSKKNGPDKFVPDIVDISGVKDVLNVEKLCRNRIKENDPTPANNF